MKATINIRKAVHRFYPPKEKRKAAWLPPGKPKKTQPAPEAPPPKTLRSPPKKVYPSPPLTDFPERIIIITDKNYAQVCSKLAEALSIEGIDAGFIDAKHETMDSPIVKKLFQGDHSRMLAIYYDPVDGRRNVFTQKINSPNDMPWALYRGSSYYRVDNLVMEDRITKPDAPENRLEWLRLMNEYYDSLTPLIMCGTECLLSINPRSVWLGQPQRFDRPFNIKKKPDTAGHITTPSLSRDIKKGTGRIRKAFDKIDFIPTQIIGYPRVSHDECEEFLDKLGFFIIAMMKYDGGLGYTGLEALDHSCLVISKNSKNAKLIQSPIIDAKTPGQLIKKLKYYVDNPDEYHHTRKQQFMWARTNFSYHGIASRLKRIINAAIDNNWKPPLKFRKL